MRDFNNEKVGFNLYFPPFLIKLQFRLVVLLYLPGIHRIQHANPQGFPASYALVHFSSVGSGMV